MWEPNIHRLDDGRLVAYYSSEGLKEGGYNQLLAHKVSADGGRSWGEETVDVAISGGVERPGIAVVDRLPDGSYVMSYEDIDGPRNGQVYLKFSTDGMHWGDPHDRGTPVHTPAGAWPAASPFVRWLPWRGGHGVVAVLAERAGGDGDPSGRSLYWNNTGGRGPGSLHIRQRLISMAVTPFSQSPSREWMLFIASKWVIKSFAYH